MRDAPDDDPLLSPPPPTEAKAWLEYYHFGEKQVELVLSYVQQEGTADDIKDLDKDDFEGMITEMEMDRKGVASFRELVAALGEETRPTDALLAKVGASASAKFSLEEVLRQIVGLKPDDADVQKIREALETL